PVRPTYQGRPGHGGSGRRPALVLLRRNPDPPATASILARVPEPASVHLWIHSAPGQRLQNLPTKALVLFPTKDGRMEPLVSAGVAMVDIVVQPARFFTRPRRADDEFGHGCQVTQLDQVGIDRVVPVVSVNLFLD